MIEIILLFLKDCLAGVVSHMICKWLDKPGDNKQSKKD